MKCIMNSKLDGSLFSIKDTPIQHFFEFQITENIHTGPELDNSDLFDQMEHPDDFPGLMDGDDSDDEGDLTDVIQNIIIDLLIYYCLSLLNSFILMILFCTVLFNKVHLRLPRTDSHQVTGTDHVMSFGGY